MWDLPTLPPWGHNVGLPDEVKETDAAILCDGLGYSWALTILLFRVRICSVTLVWTRSWTVELFSEELTEYFGKVK